MATNREKRAAAIKDVQDRLDDLLQNPKNTLKWQRQVDALKREKRRVGKVSIGSTTMGQYFEACMVYGLNEIVNKINKTDVPYDKVESFFFMFSRAIDFSQMKVSGANADAVYAFQHVMTSRNDTADDHFQKNSSRSYEQIQTIKEEIEAMVRNFIGIEFPQKFGEELLKFGTSKISIKGIGAADSGGKGDPIGDIKLQIGDQTFILEIKYQEMAYSDIPIRWFTGLSDEQLFGRKFAAYIAENFHLYWNHNMDEDSWIKRLQILATKRFLFKEYGDQKAILSYLISKGQVQRLAAKEDPSIKGATKMVIHGHKGALTITGTADLINSINNSLAGIKRQKKGMESNYTLFTSKNNSFIFTDSAANQLAAFGLTNFGKETQKTKSAHERYSTSDEIRKRANFSFSMWVAQKFLYTPKNYLGK